MIDRALFAHEREESVFAELELVPFEKQIAHYYAEHRQPGLLPDLYGKTVHVSASQFKELHDMAGQLAALLDMPLPDIYVYENFYYTVESKGMADSWIEMSAKTLIELHPAEVMFLLAKEMCAIKLNHTYYYTLIEELLNVIATNRLPVIGVAQDVANRVEKVRLYRWIRISHYTTDNFAYLACGDLAICAGAIVKTVLNNTFLAQHVNITEFIKQGERINALNGQEHRLSKLDEQVPYAPFRIKSLMAYAASARGLKALRKMKHEGMGM
ncbi:MAG: M48 family metallopeptidase [Clostridiales bacterium]|jgi:hypothetical protein|nr:M48 family metallopeptidase [Clostridiales bacterium]